LRPLQWTLAVDRVVVLYVRFGIDAALREDESGAATPLNSDVENSVDLERDRNTRVLRQGRDRLFDDRDAHSKTFLRI
jgi:hypothetical protein